MRAAFGKLKRGEGSGTRFVEGLRRRLSVAATLSQVYGSSRGWRIAQKVTSPMPQAHILVVDDEKLIRWSLQECLQDDGYEVTAVESGGQALHSLGEGHFDLVLLDYKLPDLDGLEVLEKLRPAEPELPVIMITAHANVEHAVRAMKAGATDYLAKPFRNEDIVLRVGRVLETVRLRQQVEQYRREEKRRFGLKNFIGKSPAIQKVLSLVERVVDSCSATILIQGESGTGKDVLARAIHLGGSRAAAPYMNITRTALPETLLESELFGHEKGSFTDAKSQKKGLLEVADGGTVFLDEIGDMSPYLQSKLLRFLQDKTFRRVGGDRDIKVDVRVIAATNKDLQALVEKGEFREDLFFRLKVIPIRLPPLREREGDVSLLVDHFIAQFNREFRKHVKGVTPAFLERLEAYPWPGNIRELRNTIERAMILGTAEEIGAEELPLDLIDESSGKSESLLGGRVQLSRQGINLEELERDLVVQALQLAGGNQTHAGRLLGINRDQIRYRVEKFGLTIPQRNEDESGAEAE